MLISALFLLFLHGNFKFHLRKYCLTFLFRTMRFFRHFSLQQALLVFNVEKISNKECIQLNFLIWIFSIESFLPVHKSGFWHTCIFEKVFQFELSSEAVYDVSFFSVLASSSKRNILNSFKKAFSNLVQYHSSSNCLIRSVLVSTESAPLGRLPFFSFFSLVYPSSVYALSYASQCIRTS